jgi:acetyl-CoA acetyltransferase
MCGSGLFALSTIANQIRNGEIECGLALGSALGVCAQPACSMDCL